MGRRHRSEGKFLFFSANTTLGWRVIREISFAKGERGVEEGRFQRVVDSVTGNHKGYQPREVDPVQPDSDRSRCALGAGEMHANAGLMGKSRTIGMSEERRKGRVHPLSGRLMPEEDFIERTKNLLAVYPQSANFADILRRKRKGLAPGGDRAVRAYPKAIEFTRA